MKTEVERRETLLHGLLSGQFSWLQKVHTSHVMTELDDDGDVTLCRVGASGMVGCRLCGKESYGNDLSALKRLCSESSSTKASTPSAEVSAPLFSSAYPQWLKMTPEEFERVLVMVDEAYARLGEVVALLRKEP